LIAQFLAARLQAFKKAVFPRAVFYRRSLTMILVISCIPGLIIGIGTYAAVTGRMESDLQRMHRNHIQQRAQTIDDQLSYLEMTFSHWAFDPAFDKRLKELDFVQGYEQVRQLYATLLVVEGSHSLISRVELYLKNPRPLMMTSEQYRFMEDGAALERFDGLLQQTKTMYWTNQLENKDNRGALALVNHLPGGSEEPMGFLVATVDQGKLMNLLETLTPYNEGATFLLKNDGSWLAAGRTPSGLEEALRKAYVKKDGDSGSFLFEYEGTTYSVNGGEFKRLGAAWTFVSAAPVTSITAPVLRLSKLIAFISLGGLLLALLLSWLGSLRLYSPVGRMVRESESLKHRLEQQMPLVREGFLLQLAQGALLRLPEEEVQERLGRLGWITGEKQPVILMLRLRRSATDKERTLPEDSGLLTFAAAELVKEHAEKWERQAEVLNFHDMSVGIVLWESPCEDETGTDRTSLLKHGKELMDSIGSRLGLRVTIAVSKRADRAGQIPYLFEEARQSLDNRTPSEESILIDLEEPRDASGLTLSRYPFALEKEIIYSLRSGWEEEANAKIGSFISGLCDSGLTERAVLQGMLQLFGSIRHAMLQVGIALPRELEGGNPYVELSALEDTEHMLEWFKSRVVTPLILQLGKEQEDEDHNVVELILGQVHMRYMEPISLDEFAGQSGASSYTVSRLFKQETGINFIDYLTKVRMDKAKELLEGTDLKINAIAEQVGYQPTYFNRIFKKLEGLTPSAYRDLSLKAWEEDRNSADRM
jgi:AraC-like DNA-binding protein